MMAKKMPMKLDFKALRQGLSLKEFYLVAKDLKAFMGQDNGMKETGIGKVALSNMRYRLIHGRYSLEL